MLLAGRDAKEERDTSKAGSCSGNKQSSYSMACNAPAQAIGRSPVYRFKDRYMVNIDRFSDDIGRY
jgi:hypothetical protein